MKPQPDASPGKSDLSQHCPGVLTSFKALQDLGFGGVVGDMPGYAVVGGPGDDVGTFSTPAVLHNPELLELQVCHSSRAPRANCVCLEPNKGPLNSDDRRAAVLYCTTCSGPSLTGCALHAHCIFNEYELIPQELRGVVVNSYVSCLAVRAGAVEDPFSQSSGAEGDMEDQSQIQLTGTVMRLDRVPADLRAVGRDTFSVHVRACDPVTAPCRDNSSGRSDYCEEPCDETIDSDLAAPKMTCPPLLLLLYVVIDRCLMLTGCKP